MTQWTEISGSSRPHEFTKPVESKKIHSGERFRNMRFRCADSLGGLSNGDGNGDGNENGKKQ